MFAGIGCVAKIERLPCWRAYYNRFAVYSGCAKYLHKRDCHYVTAMPLKNTLFCRQSVGVLKEQYFIISNLPVISQLADAGCALRWSGIGTRLKLKFRVATRQVISQLNDSAGTSLIIIRSTYHDHRILLCHICA